MQLVINSFNQKVDSAQHREGWSGSVADVLCVIKGVYEMYVYLMAVWPAETKGLLYTSLVYISICASCSHCMHVVVLNHVKVLWRSACLHWPLHELGNSTDWYGVSD